MMTAALRKMCLNDEWVAWSWKIFNVWSLIQHPLHVDFVYAKIMCSFTHLVSFCSDQLCLNKMRGSEPFKNNVRVKVLDYTLFPTGEKYFDMDKRMFAGDRANNRTVIVHNNFMVGYDTKRYRFKEHLLWNLDTNGYYSNKTSKFIIFDNTWFRPDKKQEHRALENAFFLGHILNRIVILPKFFCYNCSEKICPQPGDERPHCSAYVHYSIRGLDKVFKGKYREHVFLKNALAPDSIKKSVSPVIVFKFVPLNQRPDPNTHVDEQFLFEAGNTKSPLPKCDGKNLPDCQVISPFVSSTQSVSTKSLVTWLETYSHYAVLRFNHLYGKFVDLDREPDFKRKLADGVRVLHWRWHFWTATWQQWPKGKVWVTK